MKRTRRVFRNLDIKRSLLLLFVSISFINLCVGAVILYSLRDLGGRFSSLRDHDLNSITYLSQIERNFLKLRIALANYSIKSPADRREIRLQEKDLIRDMDRAISRFRPMAFSPFEEEKLRDWSSSFALYDQNRKTLIALIDENRLAEATRYKLEHIVPIARQAEVTLESLIVFQNKEIEKTEVEVKAEIEDKYTIIAALISVSVILAGAITWLAVGWISTTHMQRMEALNKLSSIGDMAGNLAHEINNPLTIIMMTGERLSEMSTRDQLQGSLLAKQAERITASSNRIRRITSGLRTFARDGSADPYVEFDFKSMIDEALAFCADKIRRNSVVFTTEFLSDSLRLEGRATLLSQVIVNLIGNAVDAIESRRDKWIRLQVRELGPNLEVSITDSGEGIPEKIRGKMFKVSFTTKPVGSGTGLGLGICARVVHEHQGQIYVDEKSSNTRIVIRLPKHRSASQQAA
jgi:C4-dicarboxylate-specific signal transduction histidine kinase